MPRRPLGEKAMTDAERQRKRRHRLRKARVVLDTCVLDDILGERERLVKEMHAAKQTYDLLCLAVRGETDDEAREEEARAARRVPALRLAWVKDHPGHAAADFDHWGSCAATPEQERHWGEWIVAFFAQYQ